MPSAGPLQLLRRRTRRFQTNQIKVPHISHPRLKGPSNIRPPNRSLKFILAPGLIHGISTTGLISARTLEEIGSYFNTNLSFRFRIFPKRTEEDVGTGESFSVAYLGLQSFSGLLFRQIVPTNQPLDSFVWRNYGDPYFVAQIIPSSFQKNRSVQHHYSSF